ncbi:ribonuclease HI [Oenococcus sp. UCMA 16435]|nr:ribonuclease HI [Oenococcus sp. UCMA 16435]MDI4584824.1 ribonuclease HI [Oenococcus sp. UCMA 14587]MDN6967603.1 ribonuclease HI [Oenococcus sp. UCMA 17063]
MNDSLIRVYTDGGNRNTGNKLGQHVHEHDLSAWAYIIENEKTQLVSSGFKFGATNNAMELMAVGSAFRKITNTKELKGQKIELISDSHYVLDPMEKGWLDKWMKTKKERPNLAMWQTLYPMYLELKPYLIFHWVKGHKNTIGNLHVDELLNQEMDKHK